MTRKHALNTVLLLVGATIMALGVNVGLGGIQTLGLQSPTNFVAVRDADIYQVQDNHVRFIGGVWFCIGGVFALGVWMRRLRPTLIVLCGIIAVAGLFRLSAWATGVVMTADILPSLSLELIGFPALAWWLNADLPNRSAG